MLVVKNPFTISIELRDMGLIPGSERSTGGSQGIPLQYFAWRIPWAEETDGLVRGVTKSQA